MRLGDEFMPYILVLFFLLSPAAVLACGGLFCNARTPVNQAAERILFSKIDDGLEMHVRITYQGHPLSLAGSYQCLGM